MIGARTELYDSLLSLNTVIENPPSRLTNPQSSSLCSSPDSSQYVSPDSSQHLSLESCPLDAKQSVKPLQSPQPQPANGNQQLDVIQNYPTFPSVSRQSTGLADTPLVRPGAGCSPQSLPVKDQQMTQSPETESGPEGGPIQKTFSGELLQVNQEKIQTEEGSSHLPTPPDDCVPPPSATFSLSTCSLPEVKGFLMDILCQCHYM